MDDQALSDLLDDLDVGLDLSSVASDVAPMLEALEDTSPAAVKEAAAAAVDTVWNGDLERALAAELDEFRKHVSDEPELVATIDAAREELKRPARENQVAHALVWRAAVALIQRANDNYERMAELEQALAAAPPGTHRRLALRVAPAATLAAHVGDEEAAHVVARYAYSLERGAKTPSKRRKQAETYLARMLATDERRKIVRAALAELAKLGTDEFPLASAALDQLLAEPIPKDPAKDELWVSVVVGLAEELLEEALAL